MLLPKSALLKVCHSLHLQHTLFKHFLGFYGVTYYIGFRDSFDVKVGIKLFFCYPVILIAIWNR